MKRMYLDGVGVLGPSLPSRCKILVARTVCSQSSMNSQRWANPEKGLTYRHYKDYNFPRLNHGLDNCIWRFQCLIKISVYLLLWRLHSPLWLWWCCHRWLFCTQILPITVTRIELIISYHPPITTCWAMTKHSYHQYYKLFTVTYLISQHRRQKVHQYIVLPWELQTEWSEKLRYRLT